MVEVVGVGVDICFCSWGVAFKPGFGSNDVLPVTEAVSHRRLAEVEVVRVTKLLCSCGGALTMVTYKVPGRVGRGLWVNAYTLSDAGLLYLWPVREIHPFCAEVSLFPECCRHVAVWRFRHRGERVEAVVLVFVGGVDAIFVRDPLSAPGTRDGN